MEVIGISDSDIVSDPLRGLGREHKRELDYNASE